MVDIARYAVLTAPWTVEIEEAPIPEIGRDTGVLRIEASGVCGSDVELFDGHKTDPPFPVVPGHEPVGRIERLGNDAATAWAVNEGDRVALLGLLDCGRCVPCRNGRRCIEHAHGMKAYGFRSAHLHPPLWGGFATHLYLVPQTRIVPVPDRLSVGVASLYNAMANGVEWTLSAGGVSLGDRVAILGPGPRGLACAVAAQAVGAAEIVLVGLESDRARLDLATTLTGARGVTVEGSDAEEIVSTVGGEFDVVIETTPKASAPVEAAFSLARPMGTVVLAGLKGGRTASLPVDVVVKNQLTLRSGFSKSVDSTKLALQILASEPGRFEPWASHAYPLEEVCDAVRAVEAHPDSRGEARPHHVRVEPTAHGGA